MQRDHYPELADPQMVQAVNTKASRAADLLRQAVSDHAPVSFANSLGAEDMVLTDLIWGQGIDIDIFSLDTGRLPTETHELIAQAERHYGRRMTVHVPERSSVEGFVATYGINGFYDAIDARKACCHARKVEPLRRALAGSQAWVTGLRAAQSPTRESLAPISFDEGFKLMKISPLADWSERDVWIYLLANRVPYNTLHDRDFPSIGCAPCTRAIQPGEDIRAGRWWWETPDSKECGLHVVDGKLVRVKKVDGDGTADSTTRVAA